MDALQTSFLNNAVNFPTSFPNDFRFYQWLKTVRLPTELAFMNNKQLAAGTVKKVSANIIQSYKEIIRESAEQQQNQEKYENILLKLETNEDKIQTLNELILKDYSLVHKCYNLPIPVYSVEEKSAEEAKPAFMFGNRTTRKNSANFFSLYSIHLEFDVDSHIDDPHEVKQ